MKIFEDIKRRQAQTERLLEFAAWLIGCVALLWANLLFVLI